MGYVQLLRRRFPFRGRIENGYCAMFTLANLSTCSLCLFVSHPAGIAETLFRCAAPQQHDIHATISHTSSVIGRQIRHAIYTLPRAGPRFYTGFQRCNDVVGNGLINIRSGFSKFRF